MELFKRALEVRFRSHHDKFLLAEEDEESVCQERNGAVKNARWTVEIGENRKFLRFRSCYGKYLTASNESFLLGMTGKKVVQTLPKRLDSSVEWEPIREGYQVRLKTRYGQFLRANGGVPPWRNSVTHDIPQRTTTQDWILWDVDVVQIRVPSLPKHLASSSSSEESFKIELHSPKSREEVRFFSFMASLMLPWMTIIVI